MTEIKLTNTKTRKKEVFTPYDPKDVRMYVCGPTVYDRAHIGNARPVIVFDVLYRLLRYVYGSDHVTYARNFTDVDDKINATAVARRAAGAEGSLEELIRNRTDETIAWYLEDMGALGNLEPNHAPRATEYIAKMIEMIEILINKGHAYAEQGHVLFEVDSFADYGALSGRSVEDMIAGARVEVAPYKKSPMDFVLWKPSDDDLPGWDSPWGRGRPGWHIECSAMSEALLGKTFDIHGGGNDLMFPHHENEIAQSRACNGPDTFARYWLHNEMLQVEGKKMSKSLGNFFSVRELIDQGYPGEVIRMVFLGTHYRKPMDWTEKKAREARDLLVEWYNDIEFEGVAALPSEDVIRDLSQDLNTPAVLATMRKFHSEERLAELRFGMELLGLWPRNGKIPEAFRANYQVNEVGDQIANVNWIGVLAPEVVQELNRIAILALETRNAAKKRMDFSEIDRLRSGLADVGLKLDASAKGVELTVQDELDFATLKNLP